MKGRPAAKRHAELRAFVAAALILVGLALIPATPAVAAESVTHPDGSGNYAYCNVDFIKLTPWPGQSVNGQKWFAKCNYGGATAPSLIRVRMSGASGYIESTATSADAATGGGACNTASTSAQKGWTLDSATKRLYVWFCQAHNSTSWNAMGSGPAFSSIKIVFGGLASPANDKQARVDALTATGSAPPWYPVDYFTGGVPGGDPVTTDGTGPPYSCGRTLEDAGNGRYFARLRAIRHGAIPAAVDAATLEVEWTVSWDSPPVVYASTDATVITPSIDTLDLQDPWYATFKARWQLLDGHAPDTDQDIDWSTVPDPTGGGGFVFIPPWFEDQVEGAFAELEDTVARNLAPVLRWFGVDGTTDESADFGEGVEQAWIEAQCRVLIDPSRPDLGGTSGGTTIINNYYYEGDDDPETGEPPGGSERCAELGVSKWIDRIPIIGGFLAGTINLVAGLGCLLEELFIPDWTTCGGTNPGPWCQLETEVETSFPLNILGEVDGVRSAVVGRVEVAQSGSKCATIDLSDVPPDTPLAVEPDYSVLNFHLPTPSTSGCTGTYGGARTDVENTVGDLYGWHDELRAGLRIALWLAFMFGVIRAFAPGAEKADEARVL